MKKKFSINAVETRRVGMLALFGAFLEGCGGGGAGGSNLISVGGNAVKGPLQGADVFADYNNNGVQDAGEPGTTTDENGAYDLQVTQSSTIVVKTNANTVDTSTGNLIGAGTVLKAAAGSTVVSPSTTLLHAGVDEAVLKASLGIPQNVDLATYNPFDTSAVGYNAADALAYEKASVTVYTTVKALAAAAVAAGGDADAAQASALASVVDLVQKTPTGTATSVFEDTTLLAQAVASVESSLSVDLSAVSADLVTATATVYEAVRDNMTDIQSDNTSAIISVATETLIQQVSSGTITLTDANSVSTAVAAVNLAPTDITFNSQGVVFYEGISAGTVIGSFAAVDPNSGDTHQFTLTGTDADSFSLSSSGVLTFTGVADYETQSVYSITVTATDGQKARTETFTLTVTDVSEDSVISIESGDSIVGAVTEDEAATLTASGTLSVVDDDGNGAFSTTVAYNASASSNGAAIGVLTIDAAGAWSYSVASSDSAIQALGDGETLTETFTVSTADGKDTQDVTITINGAEDIATLTSGTASLTETDAEQSTTGTLTLSDVDSTAGTVVAQTDTSGTYGTFSIDAAGAWTYNMSANNQLNAGQVVTDTFNVATTDGGASTVTVTITGTEDVATLSSDTASLTESDVAQTATGTLTLVDADTTAATVVAQTDTSGTYGTFSIDAAGDWTYNMAANEQLTAGQTVTDSFSVATTDGATASVTLTLTGTSDTFVLGSSTATFMEDPNSGFGSQYITQSISFDEVSNESGVDLVAAQNETVIMDRTNLSSGFNTDGFLGYDSYLQLSLSDVDVGSGSGTVIFSLMDGDDSLRAQGERELIVAMDVSWTDASGSTVLTVDSTQQLDGDSVTNFTGVVINDDINGSTATNQISNTFEFEFATLSPSEIVSADGSVLTLNLAQMLAVVSTLTEDSKPLFDVTTADGGYYYSLETDMPFVSGTSGEAIASISGDLDIVAVADLV